MQLVRIPDFSRPVSRIALGTRAIGGGEQWPFREGFSAEAIFKAALDEGIQFFDTAPSYGEGLAEKRIGDFTRGLSEEILVGTKCGLFRDAEGRYYSDLRPASIRREVEGSLRRLRRERLDLLQIHWPDRRTPWAETWEAMQALQAEGKVGALGLGNLRGAALRQALHQCPQAATLQIPFNALEPRAEGGDLPLCRKKNISVLGYSPLAGGLLAGILPHPAEVPPGHARGYSPWLEEPQRSRVWRLVDQWSHRAAEWGCELSTLVLAWTLRQEGLGVVITGASTPEQVHSWSRAKDLSLADADYQAMRAEAHQVRKTSPAGICSLPVTRRRRL